ncbi:MAG: hypothetical protein ACXVH3_00960 [Solirubrobacteraceae bacterium]
MDSGGRLAVGAGRERDAGVGVGVGVGEGATGGRDRAVATKARSARIGASAGALESVLPWDGGTGVASGSETGSSRAARSRRTRASARRTSPGAAAGATVGDTGATSVRSGEGPGVGGLVGAGTVVGRARRCTRMGRVATSLRAAAGGGRRLATVLLDSVRGDSEGLARGGTAGAGGATWLLRASRGRAMGASESRATTCSTGPACG